METPPGRRVLILSASAGTGHIRAAEALEKVFRSDPRVAEVVNIDALRYTNKLFRDFYSKLYARLVVSAPEFLGWWYHTSDEPWRTDATRLMLDRLNTGPLVRRIQDFDPHITVCTHFMPAGIISHLIERGKIDAHLSIVVTDFDFHAMWLSRAFHRYFVAIDETRAHLEALGLPPERITVSGIPIDPVFSEPVDRRATRKELGFDPEIPTLLLSAGALGFGPTAFVVEQLRRLTVPMQAVVTCGRSDELKATVEAAVGDDPRFRVQGYSDRMHELMGMADLFLGKPGGLTTSEALASSLPMVILSPIPGQEERNADHLLEQGIAVRCNELTTLPYKIERLLSEHGRLDAMRANARRWAKPSAARTIADTLLTDDLPPLHIGEEQRRRMADAAGPA
jgi:processive 1,2-diacylglycerol beta-glucosyltransferase